MESLLIARDKPIPNKTDPLYLLRYFNITSVVICFITSYNVHLSHCAYTIAICCFHYYVKSFVFYQKENVRAFIIILDMIMKAGAFES